MITDNSYILLTKMTSIEFDQTFSLGIDLEYTPMGCSKWSGAYNGMLLFNIKGDSIKDMTDHLKLVEVYTKYKGKDPYFKLFKVSELKEL